MIIEKLIRLLKQAQSAQENEELLSLIQTLTHTQTDFVIEPLHYIIEQCKKLGAYQWESLLRNLSLDTSYQGTEIAAQLTETLNQFLSHYQNYFVKNPALQEQTKSLETLSTSHTWHEKFQTLLNRLTAIDTLTPLAVTGGAEHEIYHPGLHPDFQKLGVDLPQDPDFFYDQKGYQRDILRAQIKFEFTFSNCLVRYMKPYNQIVRIVELADTFGFKLDTKFNRVFEQFYNQIGRSYSAMQPLSMLSYFFRPNPQMLHYGVIPRANRECTVKLLDAQTIVVEQLFPEFQVVRRTQEDDRVIVSPSELPFFTYRTEDKITIGENGEISNTFKAYFQDNTQERNFLELLKNYIAVPELFNSAQTLKKLKEDDIEDRSEHHLRYTTALEAFKQEITATMDSPHGSSSVLELLLLYAAVHGDRHLMELYTICHLPFGDFPCPDGISIPPLLHFLATNGHHALMERYVLQRFPNQRSLRMELDTEHNSAWHYAAMRGHVAVLKWALETYQLNPSDFWRQNRAGNTPLHSAAFNGHQHVVAYLLDQATPDIISQFNQEGYTAVQLALVRGYDFITLFLQHGISLSQTDGRGQNLLHIAITRKLVETVKVLLQHESRCPPFPSSLLTYDFQKCSPLHVAAQSGQAAIFQALLQTYRSSPYLNVIDELVTNENISGHTVLHTAACSGSTDILNAIIEIVLPQTKLLNQPNSQGLTPLMLAIQYGKIDTVKQLLTYSASCRDDLERAVVPHNIVVPDKTGPAYDLITWMVVHDQAQMLQLAEEFMQRNPLHTVCHGLNLLQHACTFNAHQCADLWLSKNNASAQRQADAFGRLPIHVVSAMTGQSNRHNFIEVLHKHDPSIIDVAEGQHGYTPLILAIRARNKDHIGYLLTLGAIADARDAAGNTPLHHAILLNAIDIAHLLLSKMPVHCDVFTPNAQGESVLDLAYQQGDVFLKLFGLARAPEQAEGEPLILTVPLRAEPTFLDLTAAFSSHLQVQPVQRSAHHYQTQALRQSLQNLLVMMPSLNSRDMQAYCVLISYLGLDYLIRHEEEGVQLRKSKIDPRIHAQLTALIAQHTDTRFSCAAISTRISSYFCGGDSAVELKLSPLHWDSPLIIKHDVRRCSIVYTLNIMGVQPGQPFYGLNPGYQYRGRSPAPLCQITFSHDISVPQQNAGAPVAIRTTVQLKDFTQGYFVTSFDRWNTMVRITHTPSTNSLQRMQDELDDYVNMGDAFAIRTALFRVPQANVVLLLRGYSETQLEHAMRQARSHFDGEAVQFFNDLKKNKQLVDRFIQALLKTQQQLTKRPIYTDELLLKTCFQSTLGKDEDNSKLSFLYLLAAHELLAKTQPDVESLYDTLQALNRIYPFVFSRLGLFFNADYTPNRFWRDVVKQFETVNPLLHGFSEIEHQGQGWEYLIATFALAQGDIGLNCLSHTLNELGSHPSSGHILRQLLVYLPEKEQRNLLYKAIKEGVTVIVSHMATYHPELFLNGPNDNANFREVLPPPLHYAVDCRQLSIIKCIKESGIVFPYMSDRGSLLDVALDKGGFLADYSRPYAYDINVVQLLLEQFPEILRHHIDTKSDRFLLHMVYWGAVDALTLIYNKKAEFLLNYRDDDGNTLLYHAIKEGQPSVFEFLVSHYQDAKLTKPNCKGQTPITALLKLAEYNLPNAMAMLSMLKRAKPNVIEQARRMTPYPETFRWEHLDCSTAYSTSHSALSIFSQPPKRDSESASIHTIPSHSS